MSNQPPVTFHHEDEEFVRKTKDSYLAKGVQLKSFELLFIAQWVEEHQEELEDLAENDLEVEKDRLFQQLCRMLREKYEVTLTDHNKTVQVIPEAWRSDSEDLSDGEPVA